MHYTTSNLIIKYSLSTHAIVILHRLNVFIVKVSVGENVLAVTVNIKCPSFCEYVKFIVIRH